MNKYHHHHISLHQKLHGTDFENRIPSYDFRLAHFDFQPSHMKDAMSSYQMGSDTGGAAGNGEMATTPCTTGGGRGQA